MGCMLFGPCVLIEQLTVEVRKSAIRSWEKMAAIAAPPNSDSEELQPVVRGFNKEFLLVGEFNLLQKKSNLKYQVKLSCTELTFAPWNDSSREITTEAPLVVKLQDVIGTECTKGTKDTDSACYFNIYAYVRKKQAPTQNTLKLASRKRTPVTVIFNQKAKFKENEKAAHLWKNTIACLLRGQKVTSEMELSSLLLPVARRMLVLINPFSGPGKALQIFQEKVVPMFAEAGVHFNLVVTERAGHAYDLMRDLKLEEWYGIVIVSGDGLIYEVVNGLMRRPDWEVAMKTPIGTVPGGSGNALSCALNFHAGESFLDKHIQNATFLLSRHLVLPLDLAAIDTVSGHRIYSFLTVNWGYMSDVDIESERLRVLGNARFTVGALVRLVGLRKYRGRVSFLPVSPYVPRQHARLRRTQSEYYAHHDDQVQTVSMKRATSTVNEQVPRSEASIDSQDDSSESSAGQKYNAGLHIQNNNSEASKESSISETAEYTGSRSQGSVNDSGNKNNNKVEFSLNEAAEIEAGSLNSNTEHMAKATESVNGAVNNKACSNEATTTANGATNISASQTSTNKERKGSCAYLRKDDLPYVPTPLLPPLSQPVPSDWVSIEGEFVSVAAIFMTHLGPDLIFSLNRRLDEGEIDLCLIHHGISRTKLLKSFLDLAEGKVKPGGDIEFLRVKAFRIEPLTSKGYMAVDGEVVEYGPIQGQMLNGVARVMANHRR